jgi:hypothetical protein
MRPTSQIEEHRLELLTKKSVSLTLIEPTKNGLNKSIMDATGVVRSYLKSNNVHDYAVQSQGINNKVVLNGLIYSDFSVFQSKVSLYRPKTKKGDPRIWFSGLTKFSVANDILAVIYFDNIIHVVNLTQLPIEKLLDSNVINPLAELIQEISFVENIISNELLTLLKQVANKGAIPSLVEADTSVGRTLEAALGIPINSSKKPDYKGIELKSFRKSTKNRKNLFAQVPGWSISKFKSSSEILDAFGYWREGNYKLYCTVSANKHNSQGLLLKIDSDISHLIETSNDTSIGDFVVWTLQKLHNRLLEKHAETFWVSAESIQVNGCEHFKYTDVEHTKKPIIAQFDLLLEQGLITVDHLIKMNSKGKVVEKGPLFKIKPSSLNLLFPPSEKYTLIN